MESACKIPKPYFIDEINVYDGFYFIIWNAPINIGINDATTVV